MIIAQTPRITIRHFLPDEGHLYINLLLDKRVTAYLPKRTPEEHTANFSATLADYSKGTTLTRWGIFDALTGEFMGIGLLKVIDGEPDRSEVGYVICDELKGRGIATETTEALLKYSFERLQLMEVFAVTDQDNIASQRVLVKAGMKPGALLMRGGDWLSYYKITAAEWF